MRLLCPRDSPGKSAGVGCHFLLQRDLPSPGIKPASLTSPALAGRFFPISVPPGKPAPPSFTHQETETQTGGPACPRGAVGTVRGEAGACSGLQGLTPLCLSEMKASHHSRSAWCGQFRACFPSSHRVWNRQKTHVQPSHGMSASPGLPGGECAQKGWV